MRKKFAQISDADGNKDVVFEITPDLADAFIAAIRNVVGVEPPRHAESFTDLIATIAQTSRVIQHLEAFRELAMVAADRTSPHADRKGIAIAAAMPPSRLYRVLEKHGRPKNRAKAYDDVVHQAIDEGAEGIGAVLDRATEIEAQRAFLAGEPKPQRPSKTWRVLLSTPTGSTRTDYRSSEAAYEFVAEERKKAESGANGTTAIRVLQWIDGDWALYERITPDRATEK